MPLIQISNLKTLIIKCRVIHMTAGDRFISEHTTCHIKLKFWIKKPTPPLHPTIQKNILPPQHMTLYMDSPLHLLCNKKSSPLCGPFLVPTEGCNLQLYLGGPSGPILIHFAENFAEFFLEIFADGLLLLI